MTKLHTMQSKNKVATVPVPGEIWDQLVPQHQMKFVLDRLIEFVVSPYFTDFGGFRIVATYPTPNGGAPQLTEILAIGREPTPDKPSIIVPGLIKPN